MDGVDLLVSLEGSGTNKPTVRWRETSRMVQPNAPSPCPKDFNV